LLPPFGWALIAQGLARASQHARYREVRRAIRCRHQMPQPVIAAASSSEFGSGTFGGETDCAPKGVAGAGAGAGLEST